MPFRPFKKSGPRPCPEPSEGWPRSCRSRLSSAPACMPGERAAEVELAGVTSFGRVVFLRSARRPYWGDPAG